MANRNNRQQGNRRQDFGRIDRSKGYGRPMPPVSPWQQGGPGAPLGNVLPLAASSEATLALANNLINNLLQSRQSNVPPSLLDMPMRRNFGGDQGFNRGFNRMGNQANFQRGPGNFNRPADRPNFRRNFRQNDGPKKQAFNQKKDNSKPKQAKQSTAPAVKKESTVQKEETKEADSDVGDKDVTMEEASSAETPGDKKEAEKTGYDAVKDASLLHCHICNKVMWDGRSFENHLNGRGHHIMMQKAAESYALTADTMRQELKIREMKHYRKIGQPGPRNFFCAMCDMYAADGASHRTTVGHRKLKKYLHPACASCHKEMATRIELDEHRLSAEHMLQVQGKKKDFGTKSKAELMVFSNLEQEESYIRHDRKGGNKRARTATNTDAAAEESKDEAADEVKEEPDAEDVVLDAKEEDDITLTSDQIPRYNPSRGVGQSQLSEMTCVHCKLCRKLLDSQETAAVHVRTWRHHVLYVKMLQRKLRDDQQAKAGKRSSAEDADDEVEAKRPKTEEDTATNGDHNDDEADADDAGEGLEDGSGWDEEAGDDEAAMEDDMGVEDKAEEGAADEDANMTAEAERWEKEVETIISDIGADGNLAQFVADEVKEEPVTPKAEVKEVAKSPAKTPARATRGRGRGRGARGRRGN